MELFKEIPGKGRLQQKRNFYIIPEKNYIIHTRIERESLNPGVNKSGLHQLIYAFWSE